MDDSSGAGSGGCRRGVRRRRGGEDPPQQVLHGVEGGRQHDAVEHRHRGLRSEVRRPDDVVQHRQRVGGEGRRRSASSRTPRC
ncbi:MAG: hypothetical protein M0C28_46705 [Candidatus Moduliflexus flocculans]|nr:hypothetical protein [Candidatus Moduliflexus flocculans]